MIFFIRKYIFSKIYFVIRKILPKIADNYIIIF